VFPRVHFINPYAYTYNHYKINVAQKKIYFDMLVTRRILPILTLFYKLSIIRRFHFLKKENHFTQKVRVYPFYSRLQSSGLGLKLHFRKTHPISIKLKALKLLAKRSGVSSLILNTSKGLMTHHEALGLGISGVLVYTLN
jgi:ribosomal protein S8